ncbi:hypothetical protein Zmor_008033 [Zophobas morio]|uniref:Uncharacterized protein n=1 Tax=Zophobas morio TaxID=2755281 RepID=A0AA38IVF2_9CUCU|nr:hypothetical protein Zmor_008033 [Zophobas morio]
MIYADSLVRLCYRELVCGYMRATATRAFTLRGLIAGFWSILIMARNVGKFIVKCTMKTPQMKRDYEAAESKFGPRRSLLERIHQAVQERALKLL